MFFRSIFERREAIKEAIANQKYEGKEKEAIFACLALQDILNTEFEDKSDD